jgi:predicted HD phosphohydrolase
MKAFTMMPPPVLAAIRAMNRTVVVSEIRHHIGSHRLGRKIVHGYIVTDAAERLIRVFQITDGPVSERILSTVLPYIADRDGEQRAA